MLERLYNYVVLQYLHDPSTFEFVNVGVFLYCPATPSQEAVVIGRARSTVGRIRDFFPVDAKAFRMTMARVNKRVDQICGQYSEGGLFSEKSTSAKIAASIVPPDSSALQWSKMAAGVTQNPMATFEQIYDRMVAKYDHKSASRRSDEEVWRPVRDELKRRNIAIDLEPKTISSGDDKINFQHAWKNGKWHVYEPLSLDLADKDGIYRKVHRWLGQLTSVAPDAHEDFIPYFIVGAPENPELELAYERAIHILGKGPNGVQVFKEEEAGTLADIIEDEFRNHNRLQHPH